jgi:hypothetical protein
MMAAAALQWMKIVNGTQVTAIMPFLLPAMCAINKVMKIAALVIVLFFVAALASAYRVWVDGRL